jgi:hypothetical protein
VNAIQSLSGVEAIFSAAVYIYDFDRPPMGFDSATISFFSQVNADIDIDLYVL